MVTIKVIFKSYLKSKTGLSELEHNLPDGSSIYDLALALGSLLGEDVRNYLIDPETGSVSVLFACNKRMCTKDHILQSGDKVAIFPALAGG
jgi:molybdopterin converting factor small subunit